MIETVWLALEIVGGGGAMFVACSMLEDWLIARKVLESPIGEAVVKKAAVIPAVAETYAAYCAAADAQEEALFREVASAWWLDPNRWGDKPKPSRVCPRHKVFLDERSHCPACDDLHGPPAGLVEPALWPDGHPVHPTPPCPNCKRSGAAHIHVTAEHGGVPSMWQCERCGCEYTKKGETRASRKRARSVIPTKPDLPYSPVIPDYPLDIPAPPTVNTGYLAGSVFDYMMTDDEWKARHRIATPTHPCGCVVDTKLHSISGPGYSFTRCMKCRRWWEPPSKGPYSEIAQGEHVHDRDDSTPDAVIACEKAARLARETRSPNHGVCPSGECNYPVAKSGGYYYCTNSRCDHHKRRWK